MGETRKRVSPARVFARPTADEIWLGPAQQAALSQLSDPAQVRVIAGPASSGKTTLLQYLGTRLHPADVVLQCRGPKDGASAVLTSLLLSADLAPWDLTEIEQRNLLTVFLHQRRSQNRRVLLLVDDAHDFKPAALEELERLLLLRIDKRPVLEIVLAGPAAVGAHWRSVSRRLGLGEPPVHILGPASQQDLTRYLEWRLARFGLQGLVTPVAAQMIARLSGGRYAASDVLCQMSLLLMRQLLLDRADARVVRQAVGALIARRNMKLETDRAFAEQPPADPRPHGYVLVSRGGKMITRVTLSERTLIGRSEHNDVSLPSPYLSRHHAVIVGTPEGYYVVDLNSANGIFLNGRRVERTVLCDDDVLGMGPFRLKVQIPEGLAERSPLPAEPSLAETAMMSQHVQESALVRRVK